MTGATKTILDPCCGSRMFWFNKSHPSVVYGDIRSETVTVTDRTHSDDGTRTLNIRPDRLMDFRALPYPDGQFQLVVFDPPHLKRAGVGSWMRAKYGALSPETWQDDIRRGFAECFRVLGAGGVLIFKWNEIQIRTRDILGLTDQQPLFGHPSGRRGGTHWICFMKETTS